MYGLLDREVAGRTLIMVTNAEEKRDPAEGGALGAHGRDKGTQLAP